MGILRRIKKLATFKLPPEFVARPLPKDQRHRRVEHRAPAQHVVYGPLPSSFFNAVNEAREHAGYDPLPAFPRGQMADAQVQHKSVDNLRSPLSRSRSKSRDRFDERRGSAEHLHQYPPGTPIKYRRRPSSSAFLQPDGSPAFLPRQQSVPSFPDAHHHFQQAQLAQHIAQQQQQQQHHDMMMMSQSAQFLPQFQQQFHPHAHMPGWFMMQHQQQPMYPFF